MIMTYTLSPKNELATCCVGRARPRGFALVATISVMVLLVLIALAMLSLSTIELRASANSDAMEEARANARLSLMLAIGELQKSVGPDQRVTAPGSIIGDSGINHPHLTGVWRSWRPDRLAPPSDYDTEKDDRFERWLVSNVDTSAVEDGGFADSGNFNHPVDLLAQGTLGDSASSELFVRAGRVPVEGRKDGNLAWAVMDEGVKARVDLPMRLNEGSLAERSGNLGASSRVSLEQIVKNFNPTGNQSAKFVSVPAVGLGTGSQLGENTHDLTTWSMGPMTNVADGGLREDINLLCDRATLPAAYKGRRVYSGNSAGLAASDPNWEQIYEYANAYKKVDNVAGRPQVTASVPDGYVPVKWEASKGGYTAQKVQPKGMVLMPVIAKVQVAFSLVTRRAHRHWGNSIRNNTGDSQRSYMLHMVYTPIVTLHNPYNVALRFDQMKLDFQDVPVAFRFYRNNQPQTTVAMPLNQLYVWYEKQPNTAKMFSMTLQNKGSNGQADPSQPIVMRPGEVRVFSPILPPGLTWSTDQIGDGSDYFDWRNNMTRNIKATPGWHGEGIGFDIDWLTPTHVFSAFDQDRLGVLGLRWTDQVKVEYKLHSPPSSKNRFAIVATLIDRANRKATRASVIEMDYGSTDDLQKLLPPPEDKQYIYPQDKEPAVTCGHLYESDGTPIAEYEKPRAFCVFSAYGKTAFGGTPGDADGRYATKPWSFSNVASSVSTADLKKEHGSHHSHELNMETMPGHAGDQIQVDPEDRGNFITGHTAIHGLKFGTHNELPIAPLQSLANLQNANLCDSGHLPKFDYPLANSFAHPLMNADTVKERGDSGDTYLDHSYLLNDALYDRYYCSTVADYIGGMFDAAKSRNRSQVMEDFIRGEAPLLDHRYVAWKPSNKSVNDMVAETVGVGATNTGYMKVAAFQMLRGEWNVNSTSVEAWKAVLAGMHRSDFPIYDALTNTIKQRDQAVNPLSRFRLPNGVVNGGTVSDPAAARQPRWNGFRELNNDELERLAEEIVKQVRDRGPFLSLSEFVNRRLNGSPQQMLSGSTANCHRRNKHQCSIR